MIKNILPKLFSTINTRIAIIGAGPGGLSVASQLARSGAVQSSEISIFDPKTQHHYQPAYTLVGGGVIGDAKRAKNKEAKYVVRDQQSVMTQGVNWVKQSVKSFDPDSNQIHLGDGNTVNYQYLVVATGLSQRWDLIPGSKEAVEDPQCPASSIYSLEGAYKTSVLREQFKGGNAIFTLPVMPIKCAGAPQKILYLSEQTFRKNGVRQNSDVHFYTTQPNLFPNCLKFADALKPIAQNKDINVHLKHQLVQVDKDQRVAMFKNLDTNDIVKTNFDFLHVVPPQTSPDFVAKSALAAGNGWVDVDQYTLQHKKFKNVFSLGDVANLPTSKTAAAIFTQAPVLVHNILVEMGKQSNQAQYQGYTSCPLFVGDQKLMLIEFKYDGKPDETLYADQTVPRKMFYHLKKEFFPFVYWNLMPRGLWYGRNVFKPTY